MQWQEMRRAFHARFQVEIEGLFHCKPYQVDQWSILSDMRLLQCLDIARTPFFEHERWMIPILHEYQVEQQPSYSPISIREGMKRLEVMMGNRRALPGRNARQYRL